MTPLGLALVLLSQVSFVVGQILLKHGMNNFGRNPRQPARVAAGLGGGIAMLTVWFLVWMGLLQKMDISYVYPFQGICPVLMVLASMLFLRERVDGRTWLGVCLITVGTVLVAISQPGVRG